MSYQERWSKKMSHTTVPLKVVGNEKGRGPGDGKRLQYVSDRGDQGLFKVWTCTFWEKLLFPFPLVTAKLISDYFDNKRCSSNKILILITRQFICTPDLRTMKSDAAQTSTNPRVHDSRCEFGPHRHWCRELRCVIASLFALHRLLPSNRLLILLERVETEIPFWNGKRNVKKMDIDRHGPRLCPTTVKFLTHLILITNYL